MILLIDNYDSFTFNIYDYIYQTGHEVKVIKNDELSLSQIKKLNFSKIILSPGPGDPYNCGVSLDVLDAFKNTHPIFGICLGHQIIATYFGDDVIKAPVPMHGKIDLVTHDQKGIFEAVTNPLNVVRYHSLIVSKNPNSPLQIAGTNAEGLIMALRHSKCRIESVQFHPEAIKTECGLKIIHNFVKSKD